MQDKLVEINGLLEVVRAKIIQARLVLPEARNDEESAEWLVDGSLGEASDCCAEAEGAIESALEALREETEEA